MQVYALRMFNFIRYGESENSIVFDLTPEEREDFMKPDSTDTKLMDEIYAEVMSDPVQHIEDIKSGKKVFTDMACVSGIIGGDLDESNGSGKSTMFEAMCYSIYDKIIRRTVNTDKKGTAGDSIAIRLNGKFPETLSECYVEMLFEVDGKIYVVKRGRSFSKSQKTGLPSDSTPFLEFKWVNAPTKDDEAQGSHRTGDTTKEIAKAVSMEYDVFVNSIMFGQSDAGKFLTGTDKVRKEMLVSALRLDNVVTGCLKEVRANIKERKEKVTELQTSVGVLEDIIGKYASVDSFKKGIKEVEAKLKTTDEEIKKLDSKITKLSQTDELKAIERIREDACRLKKDLKDLQNKRESQIKEWREHYKNSESSIKDKLETIEGYTSKISEIEKKITSKETEIKAFDQDKCEKMLEIIKKAKEVKPKYELIVGALEKDNNEMLISIAGKQSDLKRLQEEIDSLQTQLDDAKDKSEFICDKCKSKVTKGHIESELNKNKEEHKSLEEDVQKLEKAKIASEGKLAEAHTKVQKLVDKINREIEITTKIKNNGEDLVRVEEIKADLEEVRKNKVTEEENIKSVEAKKKEYLEKGNEVKSQYDGKIADLEKEKDALIEKHAEAGTKASGIKNQIESHEKEKKELVDSKASLNSEIGSQKQFIKTIQDTQKSLVETQKKLDEEEKWYTRYLLLEEICGLEGVQTRIVQKWLPLLNIHIKEVLGILTQGRMNLELHINKKSAIDLTITGGQADTFQMLSGGERMIVRLAVDISLGLLLFSRTTNKAEMIVLDEIFGPLDNSKVKAVFKLLKVLKDKFKRVLVISHKDEINKQIPHQIIIEKEPGDYGLSKVKKVV